MNTNSKWVSLGAMLYLTGTLAGPAIASEPAGQVRQTTVSYADLNLLNPEGVARLYGRLLAAAAKVCSADTERELRGQMLREACVDQAIQRAVASVAAPELTRYYARKTGREIPARVLVAGGR
jgi:UrcA family protein